MNAPLMVTYGNGLWTCPADRWNISSTTGSVGIPVGARFNVMVVKP